MKDKKTERRRTRSLLFSPKLQLKYGMYYIVIGLLSITVANFFILFLLFQMIQTGGGIDPGSQPYNIFISTLKSNIRPLALGAGLISFLLLIFSLIMTKHIVGPIHALLKHIEELKSGNYAYKTVLRKRDELKPLMVALNELSETLSHKAPSQSQYPLKKENLT